MIECTIHVSRENVREQETLLPHYNDGVMENKSKDALR